MRHLVLFGAALLTWSSIASAQSVAPDRIAAAERFAAAIDLRRMLADANEAAAVQLESQTFRALIESDPKITAARQKDPARTQAMVEKVQAILSEEVRRFTKGLEPETYRETILIYARTFTADEMRQVTDFYASPLGVKLLQKQPQLTRESIELSQRFLVAGLPAMTARLKQRLDAEIPAFAKR